MAIAPTDLSQSSASEWKTVPSGGRRDKRRRTRKRKGERGGGTDTGSGPVAVPPLIRPGRARMKGEGRPEGRPGRPESRPGRPGRRDGGERVLPRRPPRTAAVALTCEEGGPSYAEALRKARERISLADLNIERTRIRRAATGAMLIEIPGEGTKEKADELAARLKTALADMDVRVTRPMRVAELKISGLDDSINKTDVAIALGEAGETSWLQIKVGDIRRTPRGLGIMWARCPLEAAIKVAEVGRLTVGWSSARVELLKRRPLQCYRCLAVGHVRTRCPGLINRSGACHNCGREGHKARECRLVARCPVCEERGLDTGHRAGAEGCRPVAGGRPPLSNGGGVAQGAAKEGETGGRIRDYSKKLINGGE